MKVDGYSVLTHSDYFSYQASRQNHAVNAKLEEGNSTQADSKGGGTLNVAPVSEKENSPHNPEKVLLKDLSASLLKGLQQTIDIGNNLNLSTTRAEAEAVTFSTTATVRAENREIELNLNVSLSRSFVEQTKIVYENPQEQMNALMDPLIIELNGSFPTLGSKIFSFDIDSDGKSNQISMPGSSSGFLALDRNNNGTIDNGKELFGAQSGNGFQELRLFDEDKNGWIDENDPIFHKLRIWHKTESKDDLIAIGEVGIGAIYLGESATPFALKNSANDTIGMMRQSSFFLFENGKGGVVSQIDLALMGENDPRTSVSTANNSLKKLRGLSSYAPASQDSDRSENQLEKLEKQIKTLEAKLQQAAADDKASIQAQIQALQLQIMALLEH